MKQLLLFLSVLIGISAFSQSREQIREEKELRASISRFNYELNKVRSQINNWKQPDVSDLIRQRDEFLKKNEAGNGSFETLDYYKNRADYFSTQIKNRQDASTAHRNNLLLQEKHLLDTIRDMNNYLNLFQVRSIQDAKEGSIPITMNSCRAKKYKNSHSVRKSEVQTDIAELQLSKLAEQPVVADPTKGYMGKIYNHTKSTIVLFVIRDSTGIMPEKSYMVGPGETKTDYLLPGKYYTEAFVSGVSIWKDYIVVSSQVHDYLGNLVHFYVYQLDDYYVQRRYLSAR